jgi:hypothetical protein
LLRVAAAMLALVPAHHAVRASLDVYPRIFSPNAGALVVSATLPEPTRVGVRLIGPSDRELGWILNQARRTEIDYSWHGRLNGEQLRDGVYQLELVSGKQVLDESTFRLDTNAPLLTGFRVDNEGRPFSGDNAKLTTITPNGDGVRDEARVRFTLSERATIALQVIQTQRLVRAVAAETLHYGPGRHELIWAPDVKTAPRTYTLELTATDPAGNARTYGAQSAYVDRFRPAPVVRVMGIDAYFTRQSYAPGQNAVLRVATDAPSFTMQFFRVGGEPKRSYLPNEMSGVEVSEPQTISWLSHANAPFSIALRMGDWRSGVYYAQLEAPDGRIGYAPFVVRPAVLGADSRVAVVVPTNTWQAYNFRDDDGDGWANTWYAGRDDLTVTLDRPYINRGVPPRFNNYETPFLNFLARSGLKPEFLAEPDLTAIATGAELAAGYDLIVFPTHTEYVTDHEYDLVEQYRDAGGNLMFLSANNFFRRVVKRNDVLTRLARWRDIGRPEASLIGVQYRANDEGERQGNFVVGSVAAAPWLWDKTGLADGSTFGEVVGGYGVEIDATTTDSPPGTTVLAEVPDLFGPGVSAQMTYYETPEGAKVFAAGTLDFVGSCLTWPITRMLRNLWDHMSQP